MIDEMKRIRPPFPNMILQHKYLHVIGGRCSSGDLCKISADQSTTEVAKCSHKIRQGSL